MPRVSKYDSSGALINPNYITGLGAPQGLVFDSSGNLYVGNTSTNIINKYDPTGTPLNVPYINSTASVPLSVPIGLAFDTPGNLLVVNATPAGTGNKVARFNSSGTLIDQNFITGRNGPQFIAFDGFGSVYTSNGAVVGKYGELSGSVMSGSFITGLSSPEGMVVFGSTLYVAEQNNNRIGAYSISTGTGNASFSTGLCAPYGMAIAIPEPSA